MIKIGTDFSGIGAPEQALIKLGINHKCVFACDYDKYAKQSYLLNYNPDVFYDDITKRNHKETPYVDLYVAGFPCQAFSAAGKRLGFNDTRGTLFFDLLQYLKEKKPKYFILENVKGLLSHEKGRTFQIIIDCLAKTVNQQYFLTPPENLGYHIYYKVLNTKHYGIPQNRERIFIVGFREDKHSFKFPKKKILELRLKDILENNIDTKYYLSDKAIDKINRHNNQSLKNDISNCIHAGYYKGGGRDQQYIKGDLEIDWVGDFRVDEGLRIRKNKMSPCLTTRHIPMIKKKRIRRLTPLECLRLQGFPDDLYHKCKEGGLSDTQLYKQAGNSMTVDVIASIIKEILINEKNK